MLLERMISTALDVLGAAYQSRTESPLRRSAIHDRRGASREVFDGGPGGALLDQLDGVPAVGHGLVALAGVGDDLPIGGDQPPALFVGGVFVDLEPELVMAQLGPQPLDSFLTIPVVR
jgi:hypothetical protein